MGYYTRYEIDVIEGSNDLIRELIDESEEAEFAIDVDGDTLNESKWYHHVDELIEFSKKHPEALIRLSGEGEENNDLWHEYYKNGKTQMCKAEIVYPEFNPKLLE